MAEADELQRLLLKAQNLDGGWGYQNGTSWTEPTALAILALQAHSAGQSALEQGCAWLGHNQKSDGGWPPQPSIEISSWVTSLALLALSDVPSQAPAKCRQGIEWLTRQIKPELDPLERLTFRLRGIPVPLRPSGGSPWFPGTAAWIGPTAMSILALSNAARKIDDPKLRSYAASGREYILSRRCRDGGWNHGGSSYRSENANSYPEMTGMALLALYGVPALDLQVSLKRAEDYLRSPGSVEALSWLQLGLARYRPGVLDIGTNLPCRTTRDISLRLLALAGLNKTNKLLVEN